MAEQLKLQSVITKRHADTRATNMRTLAVGDIHGCLTSLTTLMKFVGLEHTDRLILLGDYLDRGPDSKGVIDWINDGF